MNDEAIEARLQQLVRQLAAGRPNEALADADALTASHDDDEALHEIRALALTALGRIDEADRAFGRAAALDPDQYFRPYRLDKKEFDAVVEETLLRLPAQFHDFLRNVEIGVEDVPSRELIADDGVEFDLLGIYIGATAESDDWGFPDRVVLYQRNLENISPDRETLLTEIRDTLLHEVGHHFGMDEETLREIEDGG